MKNQLSKSLIFKSLLVFALLITASWWMDKIDPRGYIEFTEPLGNISFYIEQMPVSSRFREGISINDSLEESPSLYLYHEKNDQIRIALSLWQGGDETKLPDILEISKKQGLELMDQGEKSISWQAISDRSKVARLAQLFLKEVAGFTPESKVQYSISNMEPVKRHE